MRGQVRLRGVGRVATDSVCAGEELRSDKPDRRARGRGAILSEYFAIAIAISAATAVLGVAVAMPASVTGVMAAALAAAAPAGADVRGDEVFTNMGPYNDTFLEGGIGVTRPLTAGIPPVAASGTWSIGGWVRSVRMQPGEVVVAAVGDSAGGVGAGGWHGIYLADGELGASLGDGVTLRGGSRLEPGRWYAVAVTYDGAVARLYLDGGELAEARVATVAVVPRLELAPVISQDSAKRPEGQFGGSPAPAVAQDSVKNQAGAYGGSPAPAVAQDSVKNPAGRFGGSPASVAPRDSANERSGHFGGSLAQFALWPDAQTTQQVQAFARAAPNFALITFNAVGVGWPWQEHAWRGLQEPQDPWTLPHAKSPPSAPVAVAPEGEPGGLRAGGDGAPEAEPAGPRAGRDGGLGAEYAGLRPGGDGASLIGGWRLMPAPRVDAGGGQLSDVSFSDGDWYPAVVPGTVLTTLIARGVYPDPDYGLNNMAIPDTLSRQDYWYRSVFSAPESFRGRDLTLVFKGINYAAEVWLNGRRLGEIRGAFTRGTFDVTGAVRVGGPNALAVRIAPPPHPGIPHEQSMSAGPGNNGGALAIDGPTFIASEGWDWIPGIRDRNTGIWQTVEIKPTGALHLGDPHVVTHLPLPRIDTADVAITVPIENHATVAVRATVIARFDGVRDCVREGLRDGVREGLRDGLRERDVVSEMESATEAEMQSETGAEMESATEAEMQSETGAETASATGSASKRR